MGARLAKGDLLAGAAAIAMVLMALVLGTPLPLAIVLAIAVYVGVVLIRAPATTGATDDADRRDIERAYDAARTHLGTVRRNQERIADPAVKDQVRRIVDTMFATVWAMFEDGNLAAAPLFNDQLLEPFDTLLEHYVRLSSRGVRSANDALHKAETHDFPMIEAAATAFLDKLHRSTVVDLAVLGEVIELNIDNLSMPRIGRPE